jgi:hypothetical protein
MKTVVEGAAADRIFRIRYDCFDRLSLCFVSLFGSVGAGPIGGISESNPKLTKEEESVVYWYSI